MWEYRSLAQKHPLYDLADRAYWSPADIDAALAVWDAALRTEATGGWELVAYAPLPHNYLLLTWRRALGAG